MKVLMRTLVLSLCGVTAGLSGDIASAHHSFANFDNTKCVTLAGTVRNYEWTFPHSWIWITVQNNKGGTDIWGFEGEPPSNLSQRGWSKTSLKKGDKITVKFSPLRSGQMGGAFSSVTLPDGKVLAGARDACSGATLNGLPAQNQKASGAAK